MMWKSITTFCAFAALSMAQTPGAQAGGTTPERLPNQQTMRIDSIPESKILHKEMPAYSPEAIDHKIQGVVKMQVVIGKDGKVEGVRLISGHPLLAPAAMQAVRRWVYEPFQLKGQPARVVTDVSIPFALDSSGKPIAQPANKSAM